jgi:hypothetical protein
MNTKLRLAVLALAFIVPSLIDLRAGDSLPARTSGHVLILDNERTLEGNIDRQGEQYRVRRSVGEVWIQGENVLRLCETREEAYTFLRSRANLRDPDEHLRLARWCQTNGLREQTMKEVSEAVELRPNHADSQRLLRNLQRAALSKPAHQAGRAHEEPDTNLAPPSVNNESLSLFVTRVQPILMNACVSCHGCGKGGAFKLVRTYGAGSASHKTTQQNLASVLGEVNLERPKSSLFLTKALSVHGDMAHPAIKGREVAAFQSLEEWVQLTVDGNPQLLEQGRGSQTPLQTVQRQPLMEHAAMVRPAPVATTPTATFAADTQAKDANTATTTSESQDPVDPFDPLIFNRQMHPDKKKDAAKSPATTGSTR